MNDFSESDPGKIWRRIARCGALLCLLATLILVQKDPASGKDSMFNIAVKVAAKLAMDIPKLIAGNARWQERTILSMVALYVTPVLVTLGAPVFLALCSPRAPQPGRRLFRVIAAAYWLVALLAVFYLFAVTQVPYLNSTGAILAWIAATVAYLAVSGMIFRRAWQLRETPACHFWLGVLPLGQMALCAWIFTGATVAAGNAREFLFILIPLFAGSVMLVVGWVKWWGTYVN